MKIELKCISFADKETRDKEGVMDIPPGTPVSRLLADLGIPVDTLGIISIDGRRVDLSTRLKEGDTLALFPVVEGG